MVPKAIVFWSNVRTADFSTSRVSTEPLACKGTSTSGKNLESIHCFFKEEFVGTGSLCLFPNMDDDGDDDGTGGGDAFFALLAFFHKLFTFSISAYRK